MLWNFLEPSHVASFFFPFLSLGEKYFKILLCLSLILHWKEAELILLKAANHKFLGVTQCLIWCEVIPKTIVIFTIMLSSFRWFLSNFSFFSLDENIIWKLYSACLEQEVWRKATSRACLRQNENIELPWEDSCININGQKHSQNSRKRSGHKSKSLLRESNCRTLTPSGNYWAEILLRLFKLAPL